MTPTAKALQIANQFGQIDGSHHRLWVIDQMVRVLTNCPSEIKNAVDCNQVPYTYESLGESLEYLEFVRLSKAGEDGPDTYEWDTGIAP